MQEAADQGWQREAFFLLGVWLVPNPKSRESQWGTSGWDVGLEHHAPRAIDPLAQTVDPTSDPQIAWGGFRGLDVPAQSDIANDAAGQAYIRRCLGKLGMTMEHRASRVIDPLAQTVDLPSDPQIAWGGFPGPMCPPKATSRTMPLDRPTFGDASTASA